MMRKPPPKKVYPRYAIDDVFHIDTDDYNIIPKRKAWSEKGKVSTGIIGFCATFEYACKLLKSAGCTADLSELEKIKTEHVNGRIKIIHPERN